MKKFLSSLLFALTVMVVATPANATDLPICNFNISGIYKRDTPTITNAGIYTTNNSGSYIRTRDVIDFSTANSWSFKWRFTYHPANNDQGVMSGNGESNVQSIIDSSGRPRFSFGSGGDANWNAGIWNDNNISFRYQDGVTYDNEIYFDGTRYGYKVDGTEIGGLDSTQKAGDTYFAIGVERTRQAQQYSRAEWDLTHTSLIVNGVEQFLWCTQPIKIATTAYNAAAFAPVEAALETAVTTIKDVVANTIVQADAIQNLQDTKQTRPDAECPAGKTCLLVQDVDGTPHWYHIFDPINEVLEPILTKHATGAFGLWNSESNSNGHWHGNDVWRQTYVDGEGSYSKAWTSGNPSRTIGGMYQTLTNGDTMNAGTWAFEYTGTAEHDATDINPGVIYGIAKCAPVGGSNNYTSSNPTKLSDAEMDASVTLLSGETMSKREAFYAVPAGTRAEAIAADATHTDAWSNKVSSDYVGNNEGNAYKYCWCKMTGIGAPGSDGTAASGTVYPVSSASPWVFNSTGGSAADCAKNCAFICAAYVRAFAGIRAAVLGGAAE